MSWLGANVMGPDQAVWALRIMARDRYSDRCWCWGERLAGQAIEYFEAEFHSPVLFKDRPPVSMVRSTSVQEGFARPNIHAQLLCRMEICVRAAQDFTPPAHRRCAFFSALSPYNERASRRGCGGPRASAASGAVAGDIVTVATTVPAGALSVSWPATPPKDATVP